jgi:hypothetical protein
MLPDKSKGVFCLEGEWEDHLTDRTSVEPYLRVLAGLGTWAGVVHRDVATRSELHYYLNKWLQRQYDVFPVAYLAFHGRPNCIELGQDEVSLEDLVDMIDGRAHDRVIYFGACETMEAPDSVLKSFCKRTGARAIVGYTHQVDWHESAAFDFLLLPELVSSALVRPMVTRLQKNHPQFVKNLGLRVATATWASPRVTS